ERDYELLLNLDADFSHQPHHIPELRNCLKQADVAIGSRYVPGGGGEGWNWKRRVMSWSINVYTRLLLGLKTHDNSGSFRCYRASQLARLDWTRFRARGYAFQEEILYRCRRLGCRFEESPIVFVDRRAGQSKIDRREMFSAIWVVFRLAVDRLLRVPVEHTGPA
ncbi:MAG: glycosyltransferase, partial [Planctomycetaceae bacterium]